MSEERPYVKFPSKGISGTAFLFITAIVLVGMFALGIAIAPPDAVLKTVGQIGNMVGEFALKMGLAAVIVAIRSIIIFWAVLDTSPRGLIARFQKSRNDSHAVLFVGEIATAAVMLVFAGGQTFNLYVHAILTRGALGYAMATIITIGIARIFGVRTMDDYRDWIDTEDNDSYAIVVAGVQVACMALALSS